jgi:hypothetical protein
VSKTFQVPNEVTSNDSKGQLSFDIEVMNGVVQDVRVQMSPDLLDPELIDLSEILLKLDFNDRLVQKFSDLLSVHSADISEVKRNFLVQCLDEMIGKFV